MDRDRVWCLPRGEGVEVEDGMGVINGDGEKLK